MMNDKEYQYLFQKGDLMYIYKPFLQILESEANAKRQCFRNQDPVKRGSILGNYFPPSR